jgi:bifunctional DNA-binding transcriptional regulator/antitoxin component of YhaV-PrlF toxin-antitoxin module
MILPLNFFRKLDASGRYVIPAQVRKEFGVNANEEIGLCLIAEDNEYYLGFKVNPSEEYLNYLKKFSQLIK